VTVQNLPIAETVELVPLDDEIAEVVIERRRLIETDRRFRERLRLALLARSETAAGVLGHRRRR